LFIWIIIGTQRGMADRVASWIREKLDTKFLSCCRRYESNVL